MWYVLNNKLKKSKNMKCENCDLSDNSKPVALVWRDIMGMCSW